MEVLIIFLISSVVFNYVHEFGHLCAAKLTGMNVQRMFVGVGPRLLSRSARDGTEYVLGLIPVAAMIIPSEEFRAAPAHHRLIVSSAGPAANFLCTFLLLAIAYVGFHPPERASVGFVEPGGIGHEVGLRSGDQIVSVNGTQTMSWSDVGLQLLGRVGDSGELALEVRRADERHAVEIPVTGWQSDVVKVDIFGFLEIRQQEQEPTGRSLFGVVDALVDTVRMFWSTAMSGFKMLFGSMSVVNFAGGLQLTQLGLDGFDLGIDDYIKLAALFSLGFGIINLLPGPVVDGLAMLTAATEWIGRRRLSTRVDKMARSVGIVLAFGPIPLCIIHEVIRLSA